MGAFLELADRIKFDTFLKDKLTMLDLPKSWVAGTTVFDFVVSKEGMTCSQVLLEGGGLGGLSFPFTLDKSPYQIMEFKHV